MKRKRGAGTLSGPALDRGSVALHEAAHAVAAVRRGVRFDTVRVLKRPSRHRTLAGGLYTGGYLKIIIREQRYLTMRYREQADGSFFMDPPKPGYDELVVLLAAAAFEKTQLRPMVSYDQLFASGCAGDIAGVHAFLDIIEAQTATLERELIINRAVRMAERLIKRERLSIHIVAFELLEAPNGRLSEHRVREIVGVIV